MTILFSLLRQFWPYIVAFTLGSFMAGGAAWKVQGLRITAAQQEFTAFKQAAVQAMQDAKDQSDQITKETNDAIPQYVAALHDYYQRNPVIRLLPPVAGPSSALPSPAHESGSGPANDVPTADDWRRAESALHACGVTTLMFVSIRDWAREQRKMSIETQKEY